MVKPIDIDAWTSCEGEELCRKAFAYAVEYANKTNGGVAISGHCQLRGILTEELMKLDQSEFKIRRLDTEAISLTHKMKRIRFIPFEKGASWFECRKWDLILVLGMPKEYRFYETVAVMGNVVVIIANHGINRYCWDIREEKNRGKTD